MKKSSGYHILGAGIAGLGAAISLAKAGKEVHVHERYDTVGKRFQGDLQGIENWSTKDDVCSHLHSFGLNLDFPKTPFYEVMFTDGKNSFSRTSKEPLFYLVKRGPFEDSLDTALCKQAVDHGVKIHYRSTIPPETASLIATGPLRQALIAIDKGVVFPSSLPNMAVGIFHDDLAYLGYSYLLVTNGYGCLCSVVFHDFSRLNKCFERTVEIAQKMYQLDLQHAKPVGGQGSFSLNHPLRMNNSLLIGEAGGFQDLLWGFGIRSALTSGYLASQALLTQQSYEKLVHTHLRPTLKATIVTRFLWEKAKWQSRPIVPMLMKFSTSLRKPLHYLYRFTPFHWLLFPFAKRYIQKKYPQSI